MSNKSFSKEYPLTPEDMRSIFEFCAHKNGLSMVFMEGSNAEIHIHIEQGDNMRDKYEAGQAGALGPNAHAHDISFNQIWHQIKDDIDLQILARELNTLHDELQKSAKNAEDYVQVRAIANAEIEAKKGNGQKSLSALAKASKRTLSIAEKIGIAVAAAAIKAACGF